MNDHELQKKKDVYHMILPGIDVDTMFDNPSNKRVKKMAQLPPINIPSIGDKPVGGALPTAPATPQPLPPLGGALGEAPAPQIPPPPLPGGVPAVSGVGGESALPPLPEGPEKEKKPKKELSDKDKDEILQAISELKEKINDAKSEFEMSAMKDEILERVKGHYRHLEDELKSLKKRDIPERKFFDTEGAYRDRLYGMATNMLDEFLPVLFEEIPEYNFTATQISRMFDDGTVADAMIVLMATVPREGMKYDFKVEIPVLNGLMQYPMYIQRGQRIIPLTNSEIQRELNSMSYRKLDVNEPYLKDNIFNNIGENIHRRPDSQKWYEVAPNTYNQTVIPPDHLLATQRGKGR